MRVVIQRISSASVTINNNITRFSGYGLLVFLGIEDGEGIEDVDWLAQKIVNLRIFYDEQGLKNNSLLDVDGDLMLISQFTLHASTKKGNRPSYFRAAKTEVAIPIYENFINALEIALGKKIITGEFGAYMKINLVNDGPVTITIDTKNKE